jgi:hypothetical protein
MDWTVPMTWRAALVAGVLLIMNPPLGICAEACSPIVAEENVVASGNEFTLADLLAPFTCLKLRRAAAQIGLGATPRRGSVRVIRGQPIRQWIGEIAGELDIPGPLDERIPERIVVRRSGTIKPCAEIARSALTSVSLSGGARLSLENFECTGGQSVPRDAELEVIRSWWDASLARWEFSLRCTRVGECVPFLISATENRSRIGLGDRVGRSVTHGLTPDSSSEIAERLIRPGQTATLRWDKHGIRVVLPVTCLDGGVAGQTVRVRFKSAARIMRAEILDDGTLQADL